MCIRDRHDYCRSLFDYEIDILGYLSDGNRPNINWNFFDWFYTIIFYWSFRRVYYEYQYQSDEKTVGCRGKKIEFLNQRCRG